MYIFRLEYIALVTLKFYITNTRHNMPEKSLPCSHHIFLYPFTFEGEADVDERKWKKDIFSITKATPKNYNAWAYFHRATKPALFGDEEKLLRRYKYCHFDAKPKPTYTIDIVGESKLYCLTITQITLAIYSTGVGILAFHLDNHDYHSSNDILKINDFGRRCYPQFLGEGTEGTNPLSTPQSAFLAKNIVISINYDTLSEDFTAFNRENFDFKQAYIPAFVKRLLSDDFCKKHKVVPIIDDRMFVICWYGNDEQSDALKTRSIERRNIQKIPYLDNKAERDFWYKYIFIDSKNKGINNVSMQKRLIEESTYERWSNDGTLFGITRYSFMLIADSRWFSKNILLNHIKTMYFQMVQLCLVQRASIIKLQTDIAKINPNENAKDNLAAIEKIYKNDLTFINKIFFREVSPQEQGIELYKKLHERMEIPAQMKELDGEIQQLHAYTTLLEDQRTSDALDMLALMGSIFLVPSFLISFYGANVLPELNDKTIIMPLMGICALAAIVSYGIYWAKTRCKNSIMLIFAIALIALLYIATIKMPTCYKKDKDPTQIDSTQCCQFLRQDSLLLHHIQHDTTSVRTKK